jgi:thiol:disulfide interchange protein DsbA
MTRIKIFLLATALSLAAACGKAPDKPAAATDAAAPIAAPVAAEPAADAAPTATVVEESAGTEASAPVDNGALGKDIVLAANTPAAASAPVKTEWQYKEGKHYNALTSAQGTSSAPGKIEVAEVFWYGCPHCYDLEPVLSDWVKKLPADVSFVRIPVMWNPVNEMHGRAYYTAEALGKLPQINQAMFRAIHQEKRPMLEEKDIQKLFEENGVSAADFSKTFRSFSVESQLKRAKDLTVKYRVRGVPLLVVDGKYTTDGPEIRSHQDLLAVTEELVQRERQRN